MKSRLQSYGQMLLLGMTIAIAGCSPAKHYRDYQDVRSLFATSGFYYLLHPFSLCRAEFRV